MAKGNNYWLGKGTVLISGVKYKTGQKIPLDKVDSKKAEEWLDSGVVGHAPFNHAESKAVQTMAEKHKSEMAVLSGKLVEADQLIEELRKGGKDKGVAKLKKQAVDDAARIAELETEVESLTTPGADGKKDGDKKDGDK